MDIKNITTKLNLNLSQRQRIIVAICYLLILFGLYKLAGGSFNIIWSGNIDSSIWFYSGAFMIILGSYIVEPYFTKPSDSIANSIAVLIALLGLSDKINFYGYQFSFYYALTILILSIITISLKDANSNFWKKIGKSFYWFVENFGTSKCIFSIVYLLAIYSYFSTPEKINTFIYLTVFWICLVFFDVVGIIVEKISKLINYISNRIGYELGEAIGCENPLLYKVEIDYAKHKASPVKYGDLVAIETSANIGSIGMVVDIKQLLNKKWLSVYFLQDENGDILKINLKDKKIATDLKSIFVKENLSYLLDINTIDEGIKKEIEKNLLYKNKNQFIGYVCSGSNINILNFLIVRDFDKLKQKISEGAIIKTSIYGQETLYQVIDGNSKEEHLENFDKYGFIVGIARKLGKYNKETKDLDASRWMPSTFSPLFFAFSGEILQEKIKEIAENAIGRLPETDLEIPIKDINSIVTHNTAVLGILGIGKSCLAYELIKKVSAKDIKVICIDITNEYKKELSNYIPDTGIVADDENALNCINSKYDYIHIENQGLKNEKENPDKSGNILDYKKALNKDLCEFIFGQSTIPSSRNFDLSKKIKIYNPDYHKASKGEKIGYNVITTDLTQAEKTRIITEELFKILMTIPLSDEKKAKIFLVFEEAHSLIPEWNSVASEGDKNAVNGTAKIILQGRKYGLGSMVITQRTANVSKSILNQCNTIFALRIFDDTGKTFLENYVGKDYANTLATLEERHAIAIGKGLKLKQPVIIQLNDQKNIIN